MNTRLRGVYVITPTITNFTHAEVDRILQITDSVLAAGATILQFRCKTTRNERLKKKFAEECRTICLQYKSIFIVNDDPYFAADLHADGVHLGRYDTSVDRARAILGTQSIIGASCYNELACAHRMRDLGVDYVAFGAFYPSVTKPEAKSATIELLQTARTTIQLPIVAIGGITVKNGARLLQVGADILAVSSALYDSEDAADVVKILRQMFRKHT